MTKSQHSASLLQPAKLCRLLLVLICIKLCFIGTMLIEPAGFFFPDGQQSPRVLEDVGTAVQSQTAVAPVTAPVIMPERAGLPPQASPQRSGGAAAGTTTPPAPRTKMNMAFSPRSAWAAEAGVPPAQTPSDTQNLSLARESLARRQEELARKEQDLRALEQDINDRLEQMQALEARLKVMLKDAEEIKDEKYRKLVDMLSNMKAKQAAGVLETLDERIAVKVLSGMRGRQSGEILTFVNPAKAARLAEALTRMQLPLE